jgi:hypothetical protein
MSEPRFSQDLQDCQDFKNQQNNPAKLNKIKVQDNAGVPRGCPTNRQFGMQLFLRNFQNNIRKSRIFAGNLIYNNLLC